MAILAQLGEMADIAFTISGPPARRELRKLTTAQPELKDEFTRVHLSAVGLLMSENQTGFSHPFR